MRKLTNLPEFNFFVFGVLLNFPWEFLQVPFFDGLAEAAHWSAILTCTRATLGDGLIILIAYWATAAIWRDRLWFTRPRARQLAFYVAAGAVITLILEHLATRSTHPDWGWRYSDLMPIVPVLGIGLTPLAQWLLIPPLVAWFSRRQLR